MSRMPSLGRVPRDPASANGGDESAPGRKGLPQRTGRLSIVEKRSFRDHCLVACAILQPELSRLQEEGFLDAKQVYYIPAGLHIKTECLEERLTAQLQKALENCPPSCLPPGIRQLYHSANRPGVAGAIKACPMNSRYSPAVRAILVAAAASEGTIDLFRRTLELCAKRNYLHIGNRDGYLLTNII